ncbi:MAG: ATP-NAD kinase family protein [Candidatus Syntropharchaeia archaeon]
MGGSVGLKGTDGLVEEAIKLGARRIAEKRAKQTLNALRNGKFDIITPSKDMGEKALVDSGFECRIVYSSPDATTAYDTKRACEEFLEEKPDLLLFCGGDGTARDIYSVVQKEIPILGIPAGVKMNSAVFATNPISAAEIVMDFMRDGVEIREAEVMDTDEELYRKGILDVKIFGYARTPYKPVLVQSRKFVFHDEGEEKSKEEIARFVCEFMRDGSTYILGAGTTTKKIADKLGIEKTLLGVDVVKNGKLIARDVNERDLLSILEREERVKIIVSPIGAQGFIFGRGNQQISPEVIKRVGIENIIVVATPHKLSLSPFLFVDTGDRELDAKLSGYLSVVCGYRIAQRKAVRC